MDDFRLRDYLGLSLSELESTEAVLWKFVSEKALSLSPVDKYSSYQFLGGGWEWSAFYKDKDTVIKIPSQIFSEVSAKAYLKNTKLAYEKILGFFSKKYVAQTRFYRESSINIMEQELITGNDSSFVTFNTNNKKIVDFLKLALIMLKECEWLPDFDIRRLNNGFILKNVIIEETTFLPKIIDFTHYYDVFRLYGYRKQNEVREKGKNIVEFLDWLQDCNDK